MMTVPLDLSHKELLSPKFKQLALNISEYSFANCYLFRNTHAFEVIFDEEVFLRGKTYDDKTYLMPIFDVTKSSPSYLKKMLNQAEIFFPIPEKWEEHFVKAGFSTAFLENDSDYIYKLEKLRELNGRHLSSKRNLIAQFHEHYEAEAFPLGQKHQEDALKVLEVWMAGQNDAVEKTDYAACREAILLLDVLELFGTIYYVDQKPVAFMLGEALNPEMFVLHFAKADINYKGIYQYMHQAFAIALDGRFKFSNWEIDLGVEGLKQFKSSYEPDFLVKKIRVHR